MPRRKVETVIDSNAELTKATTAVLSAGVIRKQPLKSEWNLAEAVLPHVRTALFYGRPGTGKTYLASHCEVKKGQTVYSVTLTEETPAAELRGHFIAKGSEFVWHHGPAIRAWLEGARIVLNEIERASDDCYSFLQAYLDHDGVAQLTLPNGETVRPADNWQCIATSNMTSPTDLRDQLRTRFQATVELRQIHPAAIEQLPPDLRQIALRMTGATKETSRLTIRELLAYAQLREQVGDESAAIAAFGANGRAVLTSIRASAI